MRCPVAPELVLYVVQLIEDGADDPILFEAWAEDREHSIEQAEDAYPGCEVVSSGLAA